MNNLTFREKYGVPNFIKVDFTQVVCNMTLFSNFYTDIGESVITNLNNLFTLTKLKILFFNGNLDMICDTASVQNVISNLDWPYLPLWHETEKKLWYSKNGDKKLLGNYKSYDQLTYAILYDAGHMATTEK